ncbi:MAG: tripartite tricarboxylate transporter TctB family protein [Piscinibacter sp.]
MNTYEGGPAAPGAAASSRWRNAGLPLLAAICGGAMLAEGVSLPLVAQYSGLGPGFVVAFVGAALLLLAAVMVLQILRGTDFEPEEAEGVDSEAPVSASGLGLAAAGVVVPVVSIPWLGFAIGAGLAYACVTRAFGSGRSTRDVVIGLVLSAATWFLFTRLGVQLGSFLPLMGR